MPPRCWLPRRSWRLEHNQCRSLSTFLTESPSSRFSDGLRFSAAVIFHRRRQNHRPLHWFRFWATTAFPSISRRRPSTADHSRSEKVSRGMWSLPRPQCDSGTAECLPELGFLLHCLAWRSERNGSMRCGGLLAGAFHLWRMYQRRFRRMCRRYFSAKSWLKRAWVTGERCLKQQCE